MGGKVSKESRLKVKTQNVMSDETTSGNPGEEEKPGTSKVGSYEKKTATRHGGEQPAPLFSHKRKKKAIRLSKLLSMRRVFSTDPGEEKKPGTSKVGSYEGKSTTKHEIDVIEETFHYESVGQTTDLSTDETHESITGTPEVSTDRLNLLIPFIHVNSFCGNWSALSSSKPSDPRIKEKILTNTRNKTKLFDVAGAFGMVENLELVLPNMRRMQGSWRGYDPWEETDISSLMQTFHNGILSISGPPGSGKSTLLKMIARDVMDGKYENLRHVEIVHYVDLQQVPNRDELTPSQLLFGNVVPELSEEEKQELMEFAKANPRKVLFVIDSLDSEIFYSHLHINFEEIDSQSAFFNLFTEKLFPGCQIIAASSSRFFYEHSQHHYVALTGLSLNSMKKMISGYLGSDLCDKTIRHLQSNPPLYYLCTNPLFLVYTLINLKYDPNFTAKTITGIMMPLLHNVFDSAQSGTKDFAKLLKNIKELAFYGTSQNQTIFTADDLKQFNLQPKDLAVLPIVSHDKENPNIVSFVHKTIQDTLAALKIAEMELSEFKGIYEEKILDKEHFQFVRHILFGIVFKGKEVGVTEPICEGLREDLEKNDILRSLLLQMDRYRSSLSYLMSMNEAEETLQWGGIEIYSQPLSPHNMHVIGSVVSRCDRLGYLRIFDSGLDSNLLQILGSYIIGSKVKIHELNLSDEGFKPSDDDITLLTKILDNVNESLEFCWTMTEEQYRQLQKTSKLKGITISPSLDVETETEKTSSSSSEENWQEDDVGSSGQKDEMQKTEEKMREMEIEEDELEKEILKKIKEPAKIGGKIGPQGGALELYDCSMTIPPGAVENEVEFQMLIDTDPDHFPEDRVCISPILICKPSMSFKKPVTLQLSTYCIGDGEKVEILYKKKGMKDWELLQESNFCGTNSLRFDVMHFCEKVAIMNVILTHFESIAQRLLHYTCTVGTEVYMSRKTATISCFFFLHDKIRDDVKNAMLTQDFVLVSKLPDYFDCRFGDTLQPRITCSKEYKISPIGSGTIEFDKSLQTRYQRMDFRFKPVPPAHPPLVMELNYSVKATNQPGKPKKQFHLELPWPISDSAARQSGIPGPSHANP